MTARLPLVPPLLISVVLASGSPSVARAELTKDDANRWARRVHLLATPDEEKIYKDLKDLADKEEFQRQFWARRGPDAAAAQTFRARLEATWKRADGLFSQDGRAGSETGCGQVLALLGDPQEVSGREVRQLYDNQQYSREGARRPEVWIYRSRPDDPPPFVGGVLRVSFDDACRFAEGGRGLEELRDVARRNVARPAINYASDAATGHLLPWLEPASVAYSVRLEPKLLIRAKAGASYAAGLVLAGPLAHAEGDTSARLVQVVTQALDTAGAIVASTEKTLAIPLGADGMLTGSYGIAVAPGRYTIRVTVSVGGGSAAATTEPIDVPDFDAGHLSVSPLLCYPEGSAAKPDPQGPFAAFTLGSATIAPRPGNVFSTRDSLNVIAMLYGGKLDAAVGHATVQSTFTLLKDGNPVAKGDPETFEQPSAVASVGPVPLAGYAPGVYQVRLEAKDVQAGLQETREATFEVRP